MTSTLFEQMLRGFLYFAAKSAYYIFCQIKTSRVPVQQVMSLKKSCYSLSPYARSERVEVPAFQEFLSLPLSFCVSPETVSLGCNYSFRFLFGESNSEAERPKKGSRPNQRGRRLLPRRLIIPLLHLCFLAPIF